MSSNESSGDDSDFDIISGERHIHGANCIELTYDEALT